MAKNKKLVVLAAVMIVCVMVIAVSNPTHGQQGRYELDNEITLPEYRSDIDKMIDAYERMVDRLLYANRNGVEFNADVNALSRRISKIDNKLTIISAQLTKIEKALELQKKEKQLNVTISDVNDTNSTTNMAVKTSE